MNLITTVGIELELSNVTSAVNRDIEELRRNLAAYGWTVKTDASCGQNGPGPELVSPVIATDDKLQEVAQVCQLATRLGYKVTHKCGFHVHLGVRDFNHAEPFIKFMHHFEDIFFALAPGRKQTQWCNGLSPAIVERLKLGLGWQAWQGRYYWLNGMAFARHGTLEIRLMSGSLNPVHVLGWVNFLLYTFDMCQRRLIDIPGWEKEPGDDEQVFNKLLRALKLNEDTPAELVGSQAVIGKNVRSYLIQRWYDVHSNVDAIRQERKRRRLAAWKGTEKFQPLFSTQTQTL
jgi:hypothetical protein